MGDLLNTHHRSSCKDLRHCRQCGNTRALIRKYGLNLCRRCFRENANMIGFYKYN